MEIWHTSHPMGPAMGPRWCRSCSASKASWVPGMRTVGVPQTQFLIVVDWLELDKLKQEASSGRWRRRMVTTACHGTDDSTDFWKVQHSWE